MQLEQFLINVAFGAIMKKCYRCGKIIASNEKKCSYCGVSLLGLEYCPKCSTKIDGEPDFCSNCGQQLRTNCPSCGKKLVGSPNTCPYCNSLLR